MKKVLFLAALVLGLASCQKDFTADNESRGEVSVQLSVAAPELVGATRTDGDAQNTLNSAYGAIDYLDGNATGDRQNWSKVDLRYSMEVYEEDDLVNPVKDRVVIIKDKYEPVTFELRLIPHRNYRFVVFADFVPEGTAAQAVDYANQANLGLRHTIGEKLSQITIKQDVDAINDEIADAYYKSFTYTPSNNATNKADDVILQRPYAKLRVIATDLAELNLTANPKYVTVTYGNNVVIPTTFNAVEGTISDSKNESDKTFDYTYVDNIRTNRVNHVYNCGYDDDVTVASNGTERASHLTLFTDYILATDSQSPVSFQMTVYDQDNEPIKTVDFNTNIPTQRNHLTTIIGNLMTAYTEFSVTIDDTFEEPENVVRTVDTTAELAAAVAEAADGDIILIGGEVTMPYFTNKEITFVGLNENAIVKQSPATHIDTYYSGAALNFENLTLVGEAYKNNTQGYQKAVKETYKNCHFVNYIMFAGDVTTVTDCTFVNEGQYFWTGAADNITFTNCEFNGVERAVKVCTVGNAGERTVTFNNCQFTVTNQVKSAIEIDGSKGSSYVVNINDCTATGFKVSDFTGESLFNVEGAENVKVYIDGNEWLEKGVVKDENGNYVVNSLTTLETALETASAAGAGDTTIVFAENAQLNMAGAEWTPIKVDGYNGADIVTIKGNGAVITGLEAPLFAGGFAGGSGIVIENLTIKDSNIVSANTLGSGAFIESVDSMAKIELTNCHLLNSTVTGGAGSRTGGLIGWTAGYSNVNDGPVKTYVTIDGCSVIGCTIQCDGSVGGINGHAGNNDWTYTTIKNCTIKNNTLASTDDGAWRVGVVVGTANVGEVTISNITESGNTLTQTGKTAPVGFLRNLYGRAVLGATGKLTIDGYKYVAEGLFEDANGNAVVGNQTALADALADGKTNVTLTAGNYELFGLNFAANNVTLKGADKANVVLNLEKSIYLQDKSVTLENLTYNLNAGKNYTEQEFAFVHHATAFNLKNCNVNRLRLNVYEANIEGCTFTLNTSSGFDGYCIYYYGNDNSTVNVKNSTFATAGKGICIYSEHAKAYNLNVDKCSFTSSDSATDKAAIQMHTELGIFGNVKITETTATGFADINGGLWNELNNNTKVATDKFDIWVDGTQVH